MANRHRQSLLPQPSPASALAAFSPRPRASFKLKGSLETLATTAFSRYASRLAMVDWAK